MAANSSSLGSLLTEDSLKKSRPPPGRQRGSRLDQGISGRKAKHKPVYASNQDGQLHKLSEAEVKSSKRKSNRFDQTQASGEAKNQRQPPVTPNKKSTATTTKPHREPAKYDGWDPDRICDICEARFYLTSQLARHLADPTTHLETPDLEKKAPTASNSRPGNRPGIPAFSTRLAQTSSLPLPTKSLRSISQSPAVPDRWQSKAQTSKKRSWEEYSEHENLSYPQSERFRKTEDAIESNIIDLTSPDKVTSTNVLQQPVTDRPVGRTPSTPTKSQPHPAGKFSSNSPELDRIRSSLNFQLSPPRTQPKPITEPSLCPEQQRLVKVIMSGRNVFYTGSAGCGKSTVLKNFVERLKGQFVTRFDDQRKPNQYYKTVDIIAPTGRAALDINGSTFWTYAGWTPDSMKKPLEKLKDAAQGKWVRKRLKATDVLVIDEISMVEAHHLERLNHVMQAARGNVRPFGGVQLVVTGDFWCVDICQNVSYFTDGIPVNSHPSNHLPTATNVAKVSSKAKTKHFSPVSMATDNGKIPKNGPSAPLHGRPPISYTLISQLFIAKAIASSSTSYRSAGSACLSPPRKRHCSFSTNPRPATR